MSIFHSLKIVCRGSETQRQVGDNLNYLFERFRPNYFCIVFQLASDRLIRNSLCYICRNVDRQIIVISNYMAIPVDNRKNRIYFWYISITSVNHVIKKPSIKKM